VAVGALVKWLAALLVAGLTILACTANNSEVLSFAPTGPEAIALAPYAQRYAVTVAPVEAAIDTFRSESGALPTDASVDDFVLIARPLADAIAKVDMQLRQVTWPANPLRHIKAELAADKALRLDLLGTLDVTLMVASWRNQIISAADKVSGTIRLVNTDLGLSR
jgi:hypothetical protein